MEKTPQEIATMPTAAFDKPKISKYKGIVTRNRGRWKDYLTEFESKFVYYYVRLNGNKTAAAKRAGAPNNNQANVVSSRALKRPHVVAAIAKERAKFEEESRMSRKKVLDGLLEAIQTGKLTDNAMAMVAGWREIAKMCGYYEPQKHKIDVTVNGQVVVQRLQQLPTEKLLELAEGNIIEGEVLDSSESG